MIDHIIKAIIYIIKQKEICTMEILMPGIKYGL